MPLPAGARTKSPAPVESAQRVPTTGVPAAVTPTAVTAVTEQWVVDAVSCDAVASRDHVANPGPDPTTTGDGRSSTA